MKDFFEPGQIIVESALVGERNIARVLCTNPSHFMPDIRSELEKHFQVQYAYNLSRDEIIKHIKDADALLVNPGAPYKIDRNLLEHAKRLKFIVTPSTGSDHIDKIYCDEMGIVWKALKGTEQIIENIHASAEFSFALLLAMIRHLPQAVYAARLGHWRAIEDEFRGIELSGKKVALVGYGRIGRKMGRYLNAFEAEVRVFDPYVVAKENWVRQVEQIELLLPWADIVCLHVHLDDSTRRMFDASKFRLMKKGSYFLNTARGGCVDEAALLQALETGHLRAAALDVIEGEQSECIGESPLIRYAQQHDNLMISPHIAGLTVDSQSKAARFAVDELKKFFNCQ